jgi:hypothetical protein
MLIISFSLDSHDLTPYLQSNSYSRLLGTRVQSLSYRSYAHNPNPDLAGDRKGEQMGSD